jgi:hypothetical protein
VVILYTLSYLCQHKTAINSIFEGNFQTRLKICAANFFSSAAQISILKRSQHLSRTPCSISVINREQPSLYWGEGSAERIVRNGVPQSRSVITRDEGKLRETHVYERPRLFEMRNREEKGVGEAKVTILRIIPRPVSLPSPTVSLVFRF